MDEKQFISFWIQKLSADNIKNFPEDFLIEGDTELYFLPNSSILIDEEFFGEYALIDTSGREILKTNSYEKAKYFLYANRLKPKSISIPKESKLVLTMVSQYEKYIDSIIKMIEIDYQKKFPASKAFLKVLNKIFTNLNLVRL